MILASFHSVGWNLMTLVRHNKSKTHKIEPLLSQCKSNSCRNTLLLLQLQSGVSYVYNLITKALLFPFRRSYPMQVQKDPGLSLHDLHREKEVSNTAVLSF